MAFTQREKYIGIGVGAAAAILLLNQLVWNPIADHIAELDKNTDEAQKIADDSQTQLSRQIKLTKVWNDFKKTGLTDDASDAALQAQGAVLEWARSANVNLTALQPERTSEVDQFEVTGFHVTGSGSTPQISKFLMSFETANVPLRIVDLKVAPTKEGTDDLTIQLSISTLCLKPGTDPGASTSASVGSAIDVGKVLN
jgi:hypothetical protein